MLQALRPGYLFAFVCLPVLLSVRHVLTCYILFLLLYVHLSCTAAAREAQSVIKSSNLAFPLAYEISLSVHLYILISDPCMPSPCMFTTKSMHSPADAKTQDM